MEINIEKLEKTRKYSLLGSAFLMLLIEIILLVMFSRNGEILNFRSIYWIFHFVSSILFICFCKNIMKNDLEYYDVFIIIFPVIGIIMFIFDIIFSFWKVKRAIADEILGQEDDFYNNLEKIKKDYDLSEFDVMSSYDLLLSSNNKNKKRFLFSYESKDPKLKVEILQRALLDENTEVIHYAATELNKLDAGLQEKINTLEKEREDVTDKNELKEINYKIYKFYKQYINSGLLVEEILDFYQRKTLELLQDLDIDENKKELEKINLYENMKNKKEYEKLLKDRISKYSESEMMSKYLRFLHKENRFEDLLLKYKEYNEKYGDAIEKPVFLESWKIVKIKKLKIDELK